MRRKGIRGSRLVAAGCASAALLVPPAGAGAATIRFTTTDDEHDAVANGTCSLREAVISSRDDSPVGGCGAGSGTDTIDIPAALSPVGVDHHRAAADAPDRHSLPRAGILEVEVVDGGVVARLRSRPRQSVRRRSDPASVALLSASGR